MNARRHAAARRWPIAALLAVNVAGVVAIALHARDPRPVALGTVPLSMLLAMLP